MEYLVLLLSLLVILLSVTLVIVLKRQDGYILVRKTEDRKIFTLELHKEPEEFEKMRYVRFRVIDEDLAE